MTRSKHSIEVSDQKIDPSRILSLVSVSGNGAQVLFLGVVRDFNLGKKVIAVSYDIFIPLAEKTFLDICNEAQEKWGDSLKTAICHRTGKLEVGDVSVAIAVGTPHRDEAYQASRYIIEELKVRSPIWKKEFYEDGETEWIKGHALCQHAP